jgi:Ca2+-binding RTX toxin-like protein
MKKKRCKGFPIGIAIVAILVVWLVPASASATSITATFLQADPNKYNLKATDAGGDDSTIVMTFTANPFNGLRDAVYYSNNGIADPIPPNHNRVDANTIFGPAGDLNRFIADLGNGNDLFVFSFPSESGGGIFNPDSIKIDLGPGNDGASAEFDDFKIGFPMGITGGKGNDKFKFNLDPVPSHRYIHAFGDAGRDLFSGGPGGQLLHGGPGFDLMNGGPGSDLMFGDGGPDRMFGGPGVDFMYGNGGMDFIRGGGANDHGTGGAGDDNVKD